MLITGFKRRKPRQFQHIPIYYDPEQEQRDSRNAKYDKEAYVPGSLVRGMRRERYQSNDVNAKRIAAEQRNRVIIRSLLILILLIAASFIIMNGTGIEKMLEVFMRR